MPLSAGLAFAVATLLVVPVASVASPTASTDARLGVRTCQRAAAETAGSRLLAVEVEDQLVSSFPVWRSTGDVFAGVAVGREGARQRMRVCALLPTPAGTLTSKRLRTHGPRVTVPDGSRVLAASVARPWMVWATRTAQSNRVTVHRRLIERPDQTSRSKSFRGRLEDLVAAVDGTVGVNIIDGTRQHVWSWRPGRAARALVAARSVSLASSPPDGMAPSHLRLWEPGTFQISSDEANYSPVKVTPLVNTGPRRGCLPWSARGAEAITAKTDQLRAVVDSSSPWSNRAGLIDAANEWSDGVNTEQHLKICDASGHRIYAVTSGYEEDDDYEGYNTISIVGHAIVALGSTGGGSTGSGASSGLLEHVFVRSGNTVRVVAADRVVATTTAAAWRTDNQLWVSDATGVRRLPIDGTDVIGLRLRGSTLTIARGARTEHVALTPLPQSATDVAKNPTSDAHFGVCVDQFSARCPIPESDLP